MRSILSASLACAALAYPAFTGAETPMLQPQLTAGQTIREAYTARFDRQGVGPHIMNGTISVSVGGSEDGGTLMHVAFAIAGKTAVADAIVNLSTMRVVRADGAKRSPQRTAAGIGVYYDPLFWGTPPASLSVGATWSVHLDRPWPFGPAGTARVRVVSVDAASETVTLALVGQGSGPSANDIEHPPVTTGSMDDRRVTIPTTFGKTTWIARLTLVHGITQDEQIVVEQEVLLGQTEISPVQRVVNRETLTLHRLS